MSSMVRTSLALLLAGSVLSTTVPTSANEAAEWDQARAALVASEPSSPMAWGISRWRELTGAPRFTFSEYAGFLLTYPGFPDEEKLRTQAENRLADEAIDSGQLIAFFDRLPPVTNRARAHYAIALAGAGREEEARAMALKAWRGGTMSSTAEATLISLYGYDLTLDDHDARMDALLWERAIPEAERQLARTSQDKRFIFEGRLVALQGGDPQALNSAVEMGALRDPGFAYNLVRQMRRAGRVTEAVNVLVTRPTFASLPHNRTAWVEELLTLARSAGPSNAVAIAASIDDAFAPREDVSQLEYKLRDDYTSLMWLGGTEALWKIGDSAKAAPLFYRYGAAARTPQTRSKGFYWAGLAASQAGDTEGAARYFAMAADYPERFYGMLALERLGLPTPELAVGPVAEPDPAMREAFFARPLTKAVREVARDAEWRVGIRFYREIAAQAQSEAEIALVGELAREIGRRDLAVILGEEAASKGYRNFTNLAFPMLEAPAGTDWTMVHAITRQESQFAQNAVSHAGARGLMQLMPGTAREQAGKIGVQYMSASLIDNPEYNIRLGDGYFGRMMDYYRGSYPLAVAAYNAGPGNVNKWLKANGDPRGGTVDWITWIERIPISETRNYVQRVLENAVVYEARNPNRQAFSSPRGIGQFLGVAPHQPRAALSVRVRAGAPGQPCFHKHAMAL
jgi:soluble lytic murein transglycosylase